MSMSSIRSNIPEPLCVAHVFVSILFDQLFEKKEK